MEIFLRFGDNLIKRSYIFCFLTICLFSTIEYVGKSLRHTVHPLTITALRFLIGGLVILPLAVIEYRKMDKKLTFKDFLFIGFPGILNVSIAMFFLQLSIHFGKAVMAALLVSANPVFVGIFSQFILKEKLSLVRLTGLLLGLVGIALILLADIDSLKQSDNMLLGAIFGIASAVTFGLYTTISAKIVRNYSKYFFISISFFIGSMTLFAIAALMNMDLTFPMTPTNIMSLLYLGAGVTGVAYIMYFDALKHIPAANAAMFFYIKPVIAGLLAFFLLKEEIKMFQVAGFVVIILGLDFEKLVSVIMKRKKVEK